MDNKQESTSIIEQSRKNLALIITIIGFIFGYAKQTTEISVLQKEVAEYRAQQSQAVSQLNAISNDMVYVKTTLEYLKQRI